MDRNIQDYLENIFECFLSIVDVDNHAEVLFDINGQKRNLKMKQDIHKILGPRFENEETKIIGHLKTIEDNFNSLRKMVQKAFKETRRTEEKDYFDLIQKLSSPKGLIKKEEDCINPQEMTVSIHENFEDKKTKDYYNMRLCRHCAKSVARIKIENDKLNILKSSKDKTTNTESKIENIKTGKSELLEREVQLLDRLESTTQKLQCMLMYQSKETQVDNYTTKGRNIEAEYLPTKRIGTNKSSEFFKHYTVVRNLENTEPDYEMPIFSNNLIVDKNDVLNKFKYEDSWTTIVEQNRENERQERRKRRNCSSTSCNSDYTEASIDAQYDRQSYKSLKKSKKSKKRKICTLM